MPPFVIYVAPWLSENAERALQAVLRLPGVRVALITHEARTEIPRPALNKLAAFSRVPAPLLLEGLNSAVDSLSRRFGMPSHLLGDAEEIQLLLAESREGLGIPGLDLRTTVNFRDKVRMKQLLGRAGLPCARYCIAKNPSEIERFALQAGYPIIVKPSTGARSENVCRVVKASEIRESFRKARLTSGSEVLVEEYVTGQEYSCDSFSLDGRALWHSISKYLPSPLEANYNPHVQWCVLLDGHQDSQNEDIKSLATKVLKVLGMKTGVTHMEWFRKPDGRIVISEIAARPPGAKITSLISQAHGIDFMHVWLQLLVMGKFADIPQRRFSTGAIFLRGAGSGKVVAVKGIRRVLRELGNMVVEKQIPWPGQKAALDYEGNGYIVLRHHKKNVVEDALMHIARSVDVRLSHPLRPAAPPREAK